MTMYDKYASLGKLMFHTNIDRVYIQPFILWQVTTQELKIQLTPPPLLTECQKLIFLHR